MSMLRLAISCVVLLAASSAAARDVRVRLARSQSTLQVKGAVRCDGKRFAAPVVRLDAGRMSVLGRTIASGRCTGRGQFAYGGVTWSGGVDLRVYGDRLILVGIIELERYVAGVVAAELLPRWPVESLKAMAVAARSYTLWRMGRTKSQPYHLTADVSSQVFRGLSRVPQPVLKATEATKGQLLVFKGKPIAAYYHACAAGRTATAQEVWGRGEPYLQSVVSPDLACNRINWRSAVHVNQAGKKLGVGSVRKVRVTGFTPSNRVEEVEVKGTTATRLFSGQDLRKRLGWALVRSTDFSAEIQGRQLVLTGHGSGHGVGMSQWGARGFAERGKGYREILAHYYPGAELR